MSLEDTSLPLRLRSLIEHHIKIIEHALSEYPIVGAMALREAGRAALGEIIEVKDESAAYMDNPAASKLGSLWRIINEATEVAIKVDGAAQLGKKAWDFILGTLP